MPEDFDARARAFKALKLSSSWRLKPQNGEVQRGDPKGSTMRTTGNTRKVAKKSEKICIHKLFPKIGLKPSVIHFEEL